MYRLHSARTIPHILVARPTNHELMLSFRALRRMLAVSAALAESTCHSQMFSLRDTAHKVQILRDSVVPAPSSRIAELEDMLPVSGQDYVTNSRDFYTLGLKGWVRV